MFHHLTHPAKPLLPISHQPKQNQADGGTNKIKVNPTQLSDQMDHPVFKVAVESARRLSYFPKIHSNREPYKRMVRGTVFNFASKDACPMRPGMTKQGIKLIADSHSVS